MAQTGWVDRPVDLDVALRGPRGDDEARDHVDQADHHQDEERRVPACATSRNSTSMTMNRSIDRM